MIFVTQIAVYYKVKCTSANTGSSPRKCFIPNASYDQLVFLNESCTTLNTHIVIR